MRLKIFICLLLAGITLAIYWPARHFSFVYYDDPFFLLSPEVSTGLSSYGIAWAMKGVVAQNWHPITTLSFLLMHEVFGMDAGAEHLLSAGFHAANAVLLFLVVMQMTGAMWRSALVAAIFAWHPLRVESVAWISERKDVLFAFFMLLSLLCYAWYAQPRPEKPATKGPQLAFEFPPSATACYNLALVFFILSFLSKPVVVTLPFLLLLLDVWPLQRLNRATVRDLFVEKIHFFVLAAIFCAVTFWIHKTHADVESLERFGIGTRIENTILSYVNYLGKFFWPTNLAILYPYPRSFDVVQVLLAALWLLTISALCVLQIRRRPYLAAGWFWYLVMMAPVVGLVQIGLQGMADRHTYISMVGPTMSLVWFIAEWMGTNWFRKGLAVALAVAALVACVILTGKQLPVWRDTSTLFEHTLATTPENGAAEYPMALGLEHEGLFHQAAVQYRIALTLPPDNLHYSANFYLAEIMARFGQYHDAVTHLKAALQINPDSADAMNNLAWILATCPDANIRNGPPAAHLAERACELTHYRSTTMMTTLAAAYAEEGEFDRAIATTQQAIALAQQQGNAQVYDANQGLLQVYSNHQTYSEAHPNPPAN